MKKITFFLPLLLCAMTAFSEIHLTIVPLTGAEKQYALATLGQIRFQGNTLYLYDKGGNELGHSAVADIDLIVFKEGTVSGVEDVSDSRVRVYPNPTSEKLVVSGVQAGQTLRVYSIEGQLLRTVDAGEGETVVEAGELPNGSYLLQIGADVVKFIKE